ncbi:hypothetical protein [Aquisphaera insulae]|uniref:hypothetical protein n=1 Tax=Aquisphaera insulae TaxID=2712864 RepID=UPI0013EB3048|nr:hypothetical protein [Aquisphaera insulae]
MSRSGSVLTRQVRLEPLFRPILDHPMETIAIVGAVLRVLLYAQDRSLWMDEGSLRGNIVDKGVFDFSEQLQSDQLAPVGFMIVERAIAAVLGGRRLVLRILPLACGLVSLPLLRALALKWLPGPAAILAMALFAFSADMVYYSSELKPYAGDVTVSLAILVTASNCLLRPGDRRAILAFGLVAVASPWFSFPSVFVVASSGAVLVLDSIRARDWTAVRWLAAVAVTWGLGVAGSWLYAKVMLGSTTGMYVFWDFAFPPLLPASPGDFKRLVGLLLEVLVNPLDLVPPALPATFVVFPLGLLAIGTLSLARREPGAFALVSLPVALAFLAAGLRSYPFHGRLILALVPGFYLLLAEGVGAIGRRFGRRGVWIIAAALLVHPIVSSLVEASRNHTREFNRHGDLHRNRFLE